MDFTSIIAAFISGAVTLAVCLINNQYQQRKADQEQDKRITESDHKHEMTLSEVKAANNQAIMEMSAKVQQSIAILDCKFDDLTKKVEKHNSVVERTFKLESETELIEEKLKVVSNRVNGLANDIKN